MAIPDFLLIGTAKAGTTSVYHGLNQHPDIFMSAVKEPNYFAFAGRRPTYSGIGDEKHLNSRAIYQLEDYQFLFNDAKIHQLTGEASHWNLYHPDAAKNIKHQNPDCKLIVVLRHPVERAYSTYLHMFRSGRETLPTFQDALSAENERIEKGWGWGHYLNRGLYGKQLERYYHLFEANQICVLKYQDLQIDRQAFLKKIYQFLDIDDSFIPDLSIEFNRSGKPQNMLLHDTMQRVMPLYAKIQSLVPKTVRRRLRSIHDDNLKKEPLASEIKTQIMHTFFADDIRLLNKVTGQSFADWLK